jgi:transcriptional regulator of aromatic amino acid metabolism
LRVECFDRLGIAGDILKKLADNKIHLNDLTVQTHKQSKTATVNLVVEVVDLEQLNHVCQTIKNISDVLRVQRQDHRKQSPGSKSNVTPLAPKTKTSSKSPANRRAK